MVNVKVFLLGFLSVFLIVTVILTRPASAASLVNKRGQLSECRPGVRCGWFVYNKQTRRLEDSHSACECKPSEQCVRAEDDVSISAYVYRCAPTTTQPDLSNL